MSASFCFAHLDTPDSLLPAFDVMRQLRPHLTDAHPFAARVASSASMAAGTAAQSA
ncbi:hypothetical protein M0D69_26260 [Caballeronia sp. SEWSISQ10-4 2]|uniref:hypothetical protein n=1 Tax=Caballeronia sp. SEWSISQ10-4 2 TaxID=2937438 RepID=UPI002654C05A|nr:hypothetical protein [Caballeronia sp. SEWSISQ10-4 2]MDN7181442.1 hypothetical protein [Caballeronia sp. SEWSISQ10-4 2]